MKKLDSLRLAGKLDTVSNQIPYLLSISTSPVDSAKVQILLAKLQLDQKDFAAVLPTLAEAEAKLNLPTDDLTLADIYNVRGEWAFSQDQIARAEEEHTKALGIRETYLGRESELVADSYNNLGNVFYKKQDYRYAIFQHLQALGIREDILTSDHPKLASSYNNLAACYYENGQYELALGYNQQALSIRLQNYGAFHPSVADSYNNLGNCYFAIDDLGEAIEQHEGALRIRNQINDQEGKAYTLNNLGNCYLQIGDYATAIPYFEESLTILGNVFQEDNLAIADIAANLSNALLEVGDARTALERADLALLILENNLGTGVPNLIPVLINKGTALSRMNQYATANETLERAIKLLITHFDKQHPLLATCFNNLGNNYFQQNQIDLARENYRKALAIYQQMGSYTQKEQASCLLNLGNCAQVDGQYAIALRRYDQAANLFADFQSSPAIQINIGLNKINALDALGNQSQAIALLEELLSKIENSGLPLSESQVDLFYTLGNLAAAQKEDESALAAFEKGIDGLVLLSQRFQGQTSKVNLRSRFYDLYEKAINSAEKLYQKTKNQNYRNQAFQIAEQSKALLIREAQQKTQAGTFAGIPDSILQEETNLLQAISEYEKIRFEDYDLLDSITRRQLDLELLRLKQEFAQFARSIEERFTDYYQLKYAETAIEIGPLIEQLGQRGATMLSYFIGDSTIYIFVLDAQGIDLLQVQKAEMDRQIIQLWDAITNMTSAQVAVDYESYAQTYAANAFSLYEQLIGNAQTL
ncbi:MAG: tetratricopeptide repeat protein, partial [Bacteroidota bacterium]